VLRSQVGRPLSDDEHTLLAALAFPTAGRPGDRVDLHRIAETADVCLPQAPPGHVVSVLRSLIAHNFLLAAPGGTYVISDAALRALARRRIP
jgi:hypothetical protein